MKNYPGCKVSPGTGFSRSNPEALIGVFGSKGAWPKKGREQGSMNKKFGSLGAHEFFWEVILKILCLSVKFLGLSNDCKDSPFLTINAIYSSNLSIHHLPIRKKGLRRARPIPTALVTVGNQGNPLHFS